MSRVIVFGGANLDIKARLTGPHIERTSNPGETRFSAGGVARNIAHNLARIGIATKLVSAVGDDEAGGLILQATAAAGVDVSSLQRLQGRSGTYVAVLSEAGEMITAVNDMELVGRLSPAHVEAERGAIAAADLVIADCNLASETLDAIAGLAAGKLLVEPVSVPKAAKLKALQERHAIFLATPNLDQFKALGGGTGDIASMMRPGLLQNLIVHQGANGVAVLTGQGNRHVAAFPAAHVADVTGAGDAAVAGLAFGLLQGYDLVTAARCGQAAASLKLSSLLSTPEHLSAAAILDLARTHEH